ncbi:MAG TPA: YdeI/OmpD-associated family protein [Gemmatimonadaceae bacterium]|nr:YdeI/OmpD-associated family protein [Gemmatimonadaceae bacterium]
MARASKKAAAPPDIPIVPFADQVAWNKWLDKHHTTSVGIWIRIAKKGSGIPSVSHPEALDVALCYGWIDSQRKGYDEKTFIQKFTPRGARSIWSVINRDKAVALLESGKMMPAGISEMERAKKDGRWDAAYASQATIEIPPDLQAALDAKPRAARFFATLTSQNRYAILFRVHNAKRAETRARRIADFVAMLERHETIH